MLRATLASLIFLSAGPALAQEYPVQPEPVVSADSAQTDHDQTVGAWGFQVTAAEAGASGVPGVGVLPLLGIRKWSGPTGYEAGIGVRFVQDGMPGNDPSAVIIGGSFGLLRSLGIYEHMTVFWQPEVVTLIVLPDSDTMLDDIFVFDGRLNVGTEIRLGMLGLPRIGLTAKLGAGVRISNDGDTDFIVGTRDAQATGIEALLDSTVGFVFYM